MSPPDVTGEVGDPVAELALLPPIFRDRILRELTLDQRRELGARWRRWAHDGQYPPDGAWRLWLILAGRGFGKTRAGAEWVTAQARANKDARIALVGATMEDVRRVMIEGESGLLAVARDDELLRWRPTLGELDFPSGARAFCFSAEAPDALRGPQHHAAWCDEIAKWRHVGTWDNLMLGLRLGDSPRTVVTTTPKSQILLRRLLKVRGAETTRGRTRDNLHLPPAFLESVEEMYAGTRLGRQELEGELIDDPAGALWTRAMIEACRIEVGRIAAGPSGAGRIGGDLPEHFARVVIGVDPAAGTASGEGDACGIVAVAIDNAGLGYVLEDASVAGGSPERWARAVADCAARHSADRVIAEANNGGKMVESVLRAADVSLPIKLVHAAHGKAARAEPVAALYETGKVRHVGNFAALEDEMCGLISGGGYQGPGRSPDRADALVWGLSELMLGRRRRAGVRVFG